MTRDFTPYEERKCMRCFHPRVMHLYGEWSNCTKGGCVCLKFAIYPFQLKVGEKLRNEYGQNQDTNGENESQGNQNSATPNKKFGFGNRKD